ncbi:CASP-like protein 1E1 [Hibiscus syriacus]|uniref:CASP-like protein n=1 Tax=Hibiscus syriacus TaxID=106335 RepID=A0A6A2WXE1_HIBSY|nr:CASP-like protein 1E1 [Hibiscus syriacus]KAE8660130.1 CASP-like protein 1E1 [Hibiscus syriacus]
MESQSKNKVGNGFDGTTGTHNKQVVGMPRTLSNCDLILRAVALLLTVASAIVLGVDKQTKVVPIQIIPTLPAINVAAQAKWHYLSAFVYSMVSNIIASSYAAISTTLMMLGSRNGKATVWLAQIIAVFDILMVGMLFSANGAALAIGLMGYKGNSHVRWNKVCNVFDKFCDQVAVSIVLSLLASLAFTALIALTVLTFHKRFAC